MNCFYQNNEWIVDKIPESEGLVYALAYMWLHANMLPVGVIGLGKCTNKVIKIPNWTGKGKRKLHFKNGDMEVEGYSVPVIRFAGDLFRNNKSIEGIVLQSNIEKIPKGAFEGCSRLQCLTLPKKITSIQAGTFTGCDSLTDVYYEGSKEEWEKVDIVHRGIRFINPEKLGLICETEEYEIPGNEAILNARIHYNCHTDSPCGSDFFITDGTKDITSLFKTDNF